MVLDSIKKHLQRKISCKNEIIEETNTTIMKRNSFANGFRKVYCFDIHAKNARKINKNNNDVIVLRKDWENVGQDIAKTMGVKNGGFDKKKSIK